VSNASLIPARLVLLTSVNLHVTEMSAILELSSPIVTGGMRGEVFSS